jgi:hypothetical protein
LCATGGARRQPGPISIFIHEAGAMSAYERIADVKTGWTECLLMAQRELL